MDASDAFASFVAYACIPSKASRYCELAGSPKGHKKLLSVLDHGFEHAIRPDAKRGHVDKSAECYAFHASVDFGIRYPSVSSALGTLSAMDSWLIINVEGSAGIYRPESRWDGQVEILNVRVK